MTTHFAQHPAPAVDDAQLLRRVAGRDREAFSELYDRFAPALYATILRVMNNREDADEVLQEVFVQIWDKAAGFDPALGRPFSWMLAMARNRAIDRLRSRQRRFEFLEEVSLDPTVATAQSPADEVFGPEKAGAIRAAVATLPLEQRQAIEMAFLGGMTQTEIAEALRQPLGTVKARIRRGMLKLRESLRPLL